MKKKTDYTIELIIGIFLLACLCSCSNKMNIAQGKKPQTITGHYIKGQAIHFQMRKDAKERRKNALLLTTKY